MLDEELSYRLRKTASDSVEWAEKLCDLLNESLETHCRTLEGVEAHLSKVGCPDVDGVLRDYLTVRQEEFSNLMRDSFTALQIQDVTRQAIERACDAIDKRVEVLHPAEPAGSANENDRLKEQLLQFVELEEMHRLSSAEAA